MKTRRFRIWPEEEGPEGSHTVLDTFDYSLEDAIENHVKTLASSGDWHDGQLYGMEVAPDESPMTEPKLFAIETEVELVVTVRDAI